MDRFGYLAFYNSKTIEVFAGSSYAAYKLAVAQFKPPKSKQHMVHVVLATKNGQPVAQSTAAL